jgi:hypothetical protein
MIVYCNPVPIEEATEPRDRRSMKLRAPSFPRSARNGWDTTNADTSPAPSGLAPSPLVPSPSVPVFLFPTPCSLLPALVNLPQPHPSNPTSSPPLSPQKAGHVHLYPALKRIRFCSRKDAGRRVAISPSARRRLPQTNRAVCAMPHPLGRRADRTAGTPFHPPPSMMVLFPTRPMNAIPSGPMPVFLTRTATLLPFVGLSEERVQDQTL